MVKVGAVLLPVLLLAKAYGVAGYSLTTAGVLVAADPVRVAIGTTVSYMYVLIPFAAVVCAWLLFLGDITHKWAKLALLVALLLLVALSPWYYLWRVLLVAAVVGVLAFAAAAVYGSRPKAVESSDQPEKWTFHCPKKAVTAVFGSLMAVIVLPIFLLNTIDRSWLPQEVLVLRTPLVTNALDQVVQMRPVVYVVSVDGDWITALTEKDRRIIHVPASEVVSREVCHDSNGFKGAGPMYVEYSSPNLACWRFGDDREPISDDDGCAGAFPPGEGRDPLRVRIADPDGDKVQMGEPFTVSISAPASMEASDTTTHQLVLFEPTGTRRIVEVNLTPGGTTTVEQAADLAGGRDGAGYTAVVLSEGRVVGCQRENQH